MAGHSKWANIKHRKERADQQKGKVFSRVAKEILSAVRLGGSDPKTNLRLKLAIQKAKAANFPQENIERNIKKASSTQQENYETILYEIYGHGGVGILVEITTDNKNRAASDMRIAVNKKGGSIAGPGAVSFNFDKKGIIQLDKKGKDRDLAFAAAIDAGAEDFEEIEEAFMLTSDPSDLYSVKEQLDALGWVSDEVGIDMLPKVLLTCNEEHKAANLALIGWLEELDDVDAVYHNMAL